jgi:hypothetical protein
MSRFLADQIGAGQPKVLAPISVRIEWGSHGTFEPSRLAGPLGCRYFRISVAGDHSLPGQVKGIVRSPVLEDLKGQGAWYATATCMEPRLRRHL